MPLIIAVPKEPAEYEERVALDPPTVKRLIERQGVRVQIQSGCALGAGFYDHDYENVEVFDSYQQTVASADLVVTVKPPTPDEVNRLPDGCTLITQIPAFQNESSIGALLAKNITTVAMDLLPRITRAQPMDVLSSQATVAGYKAALIAAELSPRMFPMLSTAAGTIRPSRVIVIGAGVAGLQAIATARRLGAQVEAYDIRTAAREQIESLGARMIDTGVIAEGKGGYARGLNSEERQQQHDVLAERLSHAHAVICAAAIPGRKAPLIVTKDMVERMLPDTVLVDMAAESGGNCELTRAGETYRHGHTIVVGASHLPSSGAVHASELYSRNIYNMLKLIVLEGELALDWEDEVVSSCILTHEGGLYHERSAALLKLEVVRKSAGESSASEQSGVSSSQDQSAGWIEEDTEVAERAEQEAAIEPVVATATSDDAVDEELSDAESESSTDDDGSKAGAEEILDTVVTKDDLQIIDGIGPGLQSRLYEYGVLTIDALAALDADAAVKLGTHLELEEPEVVINWASDARKIQS